MRSNVDSLVRMIEEANRYPRPLGAPNAEEWLMRLQKHARALGKGEPERTRAHSESGGGERRQRQTILADYFFEALFAFPGEIQARFIDRKDGRFYIRLRVALAFLDETGQSFFPPALIQELKDHPAFIAFQVNHFAYWGGEEITPAKACVFDAARLVEYLVVLDWGDRSR